MSYKRPNSPVKIKNFFSAWAHKQNCILYKHLYGFWEIVNAETRLEEIYFEDFKTSRTFLFLHFTFLIRASNVVKTWCLILQVVHLYGYAKTIIVFLRAAIHSNKVICLISSVSWSRINIWKCITFPKLQTIISATLSIKAILAIDILTLDVKKKTGRKGVLLASTPKKRLKSKH